jgi:hypothetical protein
MHGYRSLEGIFSVAVFRPQRRTRRGESGGMETEDASGDTVAEPTPPSSRLSVFICLAVDGADIRAGLVLAFPAAVARLAFPAAAVRREPFLPDAFLPLPFPNALDGRDVLLPLRTSDCMERPGLWSGPGHLRVKCIRP